MKKIKLLLLWIVSIFWIGLSFWQSIINFPSYFTNGELITNWFTVSPWVNYFSFPNSCISVYFIDWYPTLWYSIDWETYFDTSEFFTLLCWDFYINNYNSSNYTIMYWDFPFMSSYSSILSLPPVANYTNFYPPLWNSQLEFMNSNTCAFLSWWYWDNTMSFYSDSLYSDLLWINTWGYMFACGDIYINNTYQRWNSSLQYVPYTWFYYNGGSSNNWDSTFESPVQWGIRDFNTFLIEKAILCYMSSGTYWGSYWNCDWINYSWFVNQYEHLSPIWSWNSESGYIWNIVFNNAEPVLSNYCFNTDSIQYPFCSQLGLYSGAYLMYYFENWKLDYYVLWDWFGVDLWNLGSWQLGELTCQGVWCDNINQWLPEYIIPTNSWNSNDFGLSWDIISQDFYNDFIEKWFWFTCPYSYSWSYFVIWKDLINRLWGRDLLVPINCFISAFSTWSKMLLFWDPQYWLFWSWSLISWDTPWHQRLFLFFDLVLSFWIIFILFKLYNLFLSKK